MQSRSSHGNLLPFTRLVLVVSAVVQSIFGAVCLFLPDLWNGFFWFPPLPQIPAVAEQPLVAGEPLCRRLDHAGEEGRALKRSSRMLYCLEAMWC